MSAAEVIKDSPERSIARLRAFMPRIIPANWTSTISPAPGMLAFVNRAERLAVILTVGTHGDDRTEWVHFSLSHTARIPTWEELVRAKETFLGRDSKAIQVLPPRMQWVNIHPHVLHLFVALDVDPLPDFTEGLGTL